MKDTAFMKSVILRSSIFASLLTLLFLIPCFGAWKNSSLKDIAKPHLGVYECTQARLGEKDYLADFDYIRLELKRKNQFVISYQAKGEKKKEEKGRYQYDAERETVTFKVESIPFMKKQFPLKEGQLTIVVLLGDKTLQMQFTRQ